MFGNRPFRAYSAVMPSPIHDLFILYTNLDGNASFLFIILAPSVYKKVTVFFPKGHGMNSLSDKIIAGYLHRRFSLHERWPFNTYSALLNHLNHTSIRCSASHYIVIDFCNEDKPISIARRWSDMHKYSYDSVLIPVHEIESYLHE